MLSESKLHPQIQKYGGKYHSDHAPQECTVTIAGQNVKMITFNIQMRCQHYKDKGYYNNPWDISDETIGQHKERVELQLEHIIFKDKQSSPDIIMLQENDQGNKDLILGYCTKYGYNMIEGDNGVATLYKASTLQYDNKKLKGRYFKFKTGRNLVTRFNIVGSDAKITTDNVHFQYGKQGDAKDNKKRKHITDNINKGIITAGDFNNPDAQGKMSAIVDTNYTNKVHISEHKRRPTATGSKFTGEIIDHFIVPKNQYYMQKFYFNELSDDDIKSMTPENKKIKDAPKKIVIPPEAPVVKVIKEEPEPIKIKPRKTNKHNTEISNNKPLYKDKNDYDDTPPIAAPIKQKVYKKEDNSEEIKKNNITHPSKKTNIVKPKNIPRSTINDKSSNIKILLPEKEKNFWTDTVPGQVLRVVLYMLLIGFVLDIIGVYDNKKPTQQLDQTNPTANNKAKEHTLAAKTNDKSVDYYRRLNSTNNAEKNTKEIRSY